MQADLPPPWLPDITWGVPGLGPRIQKSTLVIPAPSAVPVPPPLPPSGAPPVQEGVSPAETALPKGESSLVVAKAFLDQLTDEQKRELCQQGKLFCCGPIHGPPIDSAQLFAALHAVFAEADRRDGVCDSASEASGPPQAKASPPSNEQVGSLSCSADATPLTGNATGTLNLES